MNNTSTITPTLKPIATLATATALACSLMASAARADGPPPGAPGAPGEPALGLSVYGVIDTAVERLSDSNGKQVTLMQKVGHVPSRLGFRDVEDLGQGLRAGINLEMGMGVDTGSSVNSSKTWARESHLTLGRRDLGELKLGRQQSLMEQGYLMFDVDHLSQYSPALAMRLANLDQDPWDNAISYRTPMWQGFSVAAAFTLAEKGRATPGQYAPQVVGAGTLRNQRAVLATWMAGPWAAGLSYQNGGQHLDTGGDAIQTLVDLSLVFRTPDWEVGGMLWTQRNALPSGTTPRTDMWMLGGAYHLNPAVKLVVQLGQARDNGQNYYAGFDKGTGRNNYLNLGADYDFSRRTTAYVRAGRISDSGDGFNGRAALSSLAVAEGLTVPANGSVKGVAIGLRHWF
jgi:predicted porin